MIGQLETTDSLVKIRFTEEPKKIVAEHKEILAELEKGGFKYKTDLRAWVAPSRSFTRLHGERIANLDDVKRQEEEEERRRANERIELQQLENRRLLAGKR